MNSTIPLEFFTFQYSTFLFSMKLGIFLDLLCFSYTALQCNVVLSSAASFTWLLITVHIDESSIYAYVLVKRIVRFVSYSHVRPQQCSVCVFTLSV
ncbi:hypothetical protein T06_2565 [Trichinella sp. T6]|nr:hypothetical protein T06_2565 [Trichinella sp. T6]